MRGTMEPAVRGSGGVAAVPGSPAGSGNPCHWFHNRHGIIDGAVSEALAGFFTAELLYEELTRQPQLDPVIEIVVDSAGAIPAGAVFACNCLLDDP